MWETPCRRVAAVEATRSSRLRLGHTVLRAGEGEGPARHAVMQALLLMLKL